MTIIEGHLFDLYSVAEGMAVWIKEEDGRMRRLLDRWRPVLRMFATPRRQKALSRLLARLRRADPAGQAREERRIEFFTDSEIPVTEWSFANADALRVLARSFPDYEAEGLYFFDADIPLETRYLAERDLYPMGRVRVEEEGGAFRHIAALSRAYDETPLPPLRIAELAMENGRPVLVSDGVSHGGDVSGLSALVQRLDPDIIVTEGGDSEIFPALADRARAAKIPLRLDRGEDRPGIRAIGRAGSFWSYNRVVRHHARWLLRGRWHLDRSHTFYLDAAGLEGLVEIARIAQVPVQAMSRTSPGSAVSSMQNAEALRRGILIPRTKGKPEEERTAWDLLVADKGGLSYAPPVGVFENVAEIDFASMYPSIMARKNVSPERVNCRCCPDAPLVPETPHRICQKKEGLVARILGPLVEHRESLKRRRNEAAERGDLAARDSFDRRQNALKWALVTSFGYLGYRNARFGRIEAHECVTAFGREALLRAKDCAEEQGFRFLHGLTDSLWITRPGMIEADALALCGKIEAATGLSIALEGVYRWIVFPESRIRRGLSVPARYFGAFLGGKIKARGIMARRRDTPRIVADAQRAAIDILSRAPLGQERPPVAAEDRLSRAVALEELKRRLPEARAVMDEALTRLSRGEIPREELLVTTRLSRDPEEYQSRSRAGTVARGKDLHAGESVSYLLAAAADPGVPDVAEYTKLMERAWSEIAGTIEAPKKPLAKPKPRRRSKSSFEETQQLSFWPEEFLSPVLSVVNESMTDTARARLHGRGASPSRGSISRSSRSP